MKKAIVLFSGGLDSTTALYWAKNKSAHLWALTIDYGQRHRLEIEFAQKICQKIGVPQKIFPIDLTQIGGSALTDLTRELPQFQDIQEIHQGVPPTYVPFRNGIFLSLAAAWGEVLGIDTIICGFNTIDSPNYPDTRSSFIQAMEKTVREGTKAAFGGQSIKIIAPFINLKKSEIIKTGLTLGADYAYSISCYSGQEIPCQKCSSCLLRAQAWQEIGQEDHLITRLKKEGKL
jgi:7-cyano-7-deazaguanine synthase